MRALVLLALCACTAPRPMLPTPHLGQPPATALRRPIDLHARVGWRDRRDPIAAAVAWAAELGTRVEAASGPEVVAWAERTGRLRPPTEEPRPGDLLVFDRAASNRDADLVAIAIGRDRRGVTELVYLAGGVVRRGFLDAARPKLHRDPEGATVNTFLRHGRRKTPRRHLAGKLLAHVIRARGE